uniref:Uncharacterized protein n=1 Tax=Arundo donax TaxID=35708 RepID=A0A0A9H8Y6_ARUDO
MWQQTKHALNVILRAIDELIPGSLARERTVSRIDVRTTETSITRDAHSSTYELSAFRSNIPNKTFIHPEQLTDQPTKN